MENNFAAVSGVAAAIVVGAVGRKLGSRPRWVRWTASLLAAVAVGGVVGFAGQYSAKYETYQTPATASTAVENEMLRLAPSIVAVMKQNDAQAWQAFIAEAVVGWLTRMAI
jgi:hypothetical protein